MMPAPPKPDPESIHRARVARRASRWLRQMMDLHVPPGDLLDDEDVPSLDYLPDDPTEEGQPIPLSGLLEEH